MYIHNKKECISRVLVSSYNNSKKSVAFVDNRSRNLQKKEEGDSNATNGVGATKQLRLDTIQLRRSRVPKWYRAYLGQSNIHSVSISDHIKHIEKGDENGNRLLGLHSLLNGNAPANVTIVDSYDVSENKIGEILWYFTSSRSGSGQLNSPINVKRSTIFPNRLSRVYIDDLTGVRALMKASRNGDAFEAIVNAAGLMSSVSRVRDTVYPNYKMRLGLNNPVQYGGLYYNVQS